MATEAHAAGRAQEQEGGTLRLPAALHAAIVAHARAGAPEEICGIVRGRGERALEIVPARNVADERIENYTVDPQTLLRQFEFEDAGDEMVAIYHSHPVSPAYPSATDAWNANYPEPVYLICSLEDPARPVLRGWRLVTHYEVAEALDWATLRAALPFREVRRGLFGRFQPSSAPLPALLAPAAVQAAPPFYLVFHAGPERTPERAPADARLVTVREVDVVVE